MCAKKYWSLTIVFGIQLSSRVTSDLVTKPATLGRVGVSRDTFSEKRSVKMERLVADNVLLPRKKIVLTKEVKENMISNKPVTV